MRNNLKAKVNFSLTLYYSFHALQVHTIFGVEYFYFLSFRSPFGQVHDQPVSSRRIGLKLWCFQSSSSWTQPMVLTSEFGIPNSENNCFFFYCFFCRFISMNNYVLCIFFYVFMCIHNNFYWFVSLYPSFRFLELSLSFISFLGTMVMRKLRQEISTYWYIARSRDRFPACLENEYN